ncbi:hypothetical protein TRICI_005111 [Trichomonascus ciferrii]|uniref:Glutamine amidotransferase type-2 domain-containing protein n=1 Tax=Trichomonascus ciferrii TaxID=44093 RepID=A0A642UWD8_9ASCO|nr:hypothetical protein TRICI_005111 [Trichomonascus ciferrii]
MCGILFSLTDRDHNNQFSTAWDELVPYIKQRGPSSCDEISVDAGSKQLKFLSSVLSLRLPFTKQPIQDSSGDILQFNGELYNPEVENNDTVFFLEKLQHKGVLPTLQALRGEYAFVYYESHTQKIWFARDCIGRRSLLYSCINGQLFITSVPSIGPVENLQEVPGGKVLSYDLNDLNLTSYTWDYGSSSHIQLQYPYSQISPDSSVPYNENEAVVELEQLLRESAGKRLFNIPQMDVASPRISVLFSGGLDCTLLGMFIDDLLAPGETVDLLNVAFENKRVGGGYNTPDRKLGKRSWLELEARSRSKYGRSSKRFRFIEIDVPFDEMMEHRPIVQHLMWPKDSVMDLSIALAFYFASRGQGILYHFDDSLSIQHTKADYTTPSKVLMSGLGADELFGGYTRHTTQLRRDGYESLSSELQLDFNRLHERNLGRDDRVCATWARELRYPFLDEQVVAWAMKCNLRLKVNSDEPDKDTKYILRLIAEKNNLPQVSLEKKRAIQFGARSAKMEVGDSKIKGTDKIQ